MKKLLIIAAFAALTITGLCRETCENVPSLGIVSAPTHFVVISFQSTATNYYSLVFSPDGEHWNIQPIIPWQQGTGGMMSFTNSVPDYGNGFYKLAWF